MTSEVESPADPALEPVEPGYKNVLRVRLLVFWLVLWVAGAVMDQVVLQSTAVAGLPTIAIPFLAAVAIVDRGRP